MESPAILGDNIAKGDGFMEFRIIQFPVTDLKEKTCMDDVLGSECGSFSSSYATGDPNISLPSSDDPWYCYSINPRARAFDYDGDGKWDEIFITGYNTSGNFFQDYGDNVNAVLSFSSGGYFSPNVQAVVDWLHAEQSGGRLDPDLWLRGHSLGGQEALLIARSYGAGSPIARLTTYGIAINTPPSAFAPFEIPAEHYVDIQDFPLSSSSAVNIMRQNAGGNMKYVINASGWSWSMNSHSRFLYFLSAMDYSGEEHPIR
jgi:pimeloyl-ACP methyl ester carboxylesterase